MATVDIRSARKEIKAAFCGGRGLARISLWWWLSWCSLWRGCGGRPQCQEVQGPAGQRTVMADTAAMLGLWTRSRSLPLAGILETERGASQAGREALGPHSGPPEPCLCAACLAVCWVVSEDAG